MKKMSEYKKRPDYLKVFSRRARGTLPEMESSKALSKIVKKLLIKNKINKILDVGCGCGHYLTSLNKIIKTKFHYTGIDFKKDFINEAKTIWSKNNNAKFDVGSIYNLRKFKNEYYDFVMCNNVILHLDDAKKAIDQLCQLKKKYLIIRTLLGPNTMIIKKVYNIKNWPYSKVPVIKQLKKNNTPVQYMNSNIFQIEYFKEIIKSSCKIKNISIFKDEDFKALNITKSMQKEGLPDATYILNGKQIFSNIIQNYYFIVVEY
tara:strand:- start:76 stop:858 length:783 start_codon:yes stop_codon:yes gene_type:complete